MCTIKVQFALARSPAAFTPSAAIHIHSQYLGAVQYLYLEIGLGFRVKDMRDDTVRTSDDFRLGGG
jgi:hypothetical protein